MSFMRQNAIFLLAISLNCGNAFSQELLNRDLPPARLVDVQFGDIPHFEEPTRAQFNKAEALVNDFMEVSENNSLSYTAGAYYFEFHRVLRLPVHERSDTAIEFREYLKELVRIGPDALPVLLFHLEDARVTQTTLTSSDPHERVLYRGEKNLWFHDHIRGNPNSPSEKSTVYTLFGESGANFPDRGNQIGSYHVKVGDLCLDAIGLIVGREYRAFAHPSSGDVDIAICSPVHDIKARERIQQIWTSDNPRRKVLESLLIDFATRGTFNGIALDGYCFAENVQIEAAARLVYYYPEISKHVIVARLDELNVSGSNWSQLKTANGVDVHNFVCAIAWTQLPEINASISRLADRTTDPNMRNAILDALKFASERK